jgi:GMP synthase (glutamine-hydrolysing)
VNQTIAIVDASVGETPAERNLIRSVDAETRVYKVSDGQFPPLPAGPDWQYDGVVISGSQTSVYDDLEWIHDLTSWVRDVHRADVPTLGFAGATSSSHSPSVGAWSI